MEHRYGRHGPRAWLRWRERRYGRPSRLPVPVEPQPTIVRVHVPIRAERIIFIVVQDTEYDIVDEDKQNQDGQQQLEFSPAAKMANWGQRQASQDIDEITDLQEMGQRISTIRWDLIRRRNKRLARKIIQEQVFPPGSSPPDEATKEVLINAYQTAHETAFNAGLSHHQLDAVTNPHLARIRQIAMQDRIDFPPTRRGAHNFHQRDLGMVRVLLELEIPLEEAEERLPETHELTDEYDKYYSNPREEVEWPDPSSFQ